MSGPDHHATLLLPPADALAVAVEAVRRDYDPLMASMIAAHVTLVYPVEHSGPEALADRLRAAAAETAPFSLALGGYAAFPPPDESGVYVSVDDAEGGFARLRRSVLAPPFTPIDFPPHVTVIHPRTSQAGPRFWAAPPAAIDAVARIEVVDLTTFDGSRWISVERFRLAGG